MFAPALVGASASASAHTKRLVDLVTAKWNIWPRAVDLDLLSCRSSAWEAEQRQARARSCRL